jgi:predicted nucleic acid-binding protein
MSVLVDSSIWIEYFRGTLSDDRIDWLIDEGLIATNDLILAELLPRLMVQRHGKLASLLRDIPCLPLAIDWPGIVEAQVRCIRRGINKVGIPDLIIAQNAKQHGAVLYTQDRHFALIAKYEGLHLF